MFPVNTCNLHAKQYPQDTARQHNMVSARGQTISDTLWLAICTYIETPSLDDLFNTDSRFLATPGFRYTEEKAVARLVRLDVEIVKRLWRDLIQTDTSHNDTQSHIYTPAVLAHMDRMIRLLTHPKVVASHGLILTTVAFCEAHHAKATYIVKCLATVMPIILSLDGDDLDEVERLLQQGQTFKLIIRTDSFEDAEVEAVEFWVTPPSLLLYLYTPFSESVWTLEAHGEGAPPDIPSAPHLILTFAETRQDGLAEAEWSFKLKVAGHGSDLRLSVKPVPKSGDGDGHV